MVVEFWTVGEKGGVFSCCCDLCDVTVKSSTRGEVLRCDA